MLDIRFIRENKELVARNSEQRGMPVDINRLLELDDRRRGLIKDIEGLRAQQNAVSEEIAAEGGAQREEKIKQMRTVKQKIEEYVKKQEEVDSEYNELMLSVPNIMIPGTPAGKSEADNVVLKEVGERPNFKFPIKDYMDIAKEFDLIDTERAGKVSGSRFGYLKNEVAILEFALVKLVMDTLLKEKFTFVIPPVIIRSAAMKAMGYIDTESDKKERYYFPEDDQYLVGTSEQSIGPMHMNEILDEKQFPLRYFSFSSCFRREAGSYGKDTKGILRVHQFDKVEMFSVTRPEDSVSEHQFLVSMEEKLMQALELPYRLMQLCSVDFARPSASTFDIETWFPSENKYRETHSCSNCTDYQSRRLNVRYKNTKTGKLEFVHMLNGTAFSQRPILAMLENFQQKDGSIKIPKSLHKFCGFKEIKKKK